MKSKDSNKIETKDLIKPKSRSKRYFWIVLIVLLLAIGVFLVFKNKGTSGSFTAAYTVAPQDVRQTVIATGTVMSSANLNLSFKSSGIISKINVVVGSKVHAGQVLATLDQTDAQAQVAVAEATVESAQVALNNAKNNYNNIVAQQQTLVSNAYATMLSSGLSASPQSSFTTVPVTISGTYSGTQQGQYTVSISQTASGNNYQVAGLESDSEVVKTSVPLPLGKLGLFITFGSGTLNSTDSWVINIPNKQSSSYLTNYNAYQAALQTQTSQVATAQGVIDTNQAALDSAKAQLIVAQNNNSNNVITAPIAGQITAIDGKLGEQVAALSEVMVLLDPNSLHVETEIPESSINQITPGLNVDMTFDALGPDEHLSGEVTSIDPASSVISGVIDFRVLSSLPANPNIKPGMTVNLNIIIADKMNVLAVPNRLIKTTNGKSYVTLISNNKTMDVPIQTGLAGDNYTEIISGLTSGEVLAQSSSTQ